MTPKESELALKAKEVLDGLASHFDKTYSLVAKVEMWASIVSNSTPHNIFSNIEKLDIAIKELVEHVSETRDAIKNS